jgi:hypothetical protein
LDATALKQPKTSTSRKSSYGNPLVFCYSWDGTVNCSSIQRAAEARKFSSGNIMANHLPPFVEAKSKPKQKKFPSRRSEFDQISFDTS